MVYESDFYTSRRPYTSTRPTVSSYSVTSPIGIYDYDYPVFSRVHTYTSSYPIYSSYPTVIHRTIPYVAHKRLVTGTRLSTTPTRVITSPIRMIRSPARVITSPIRIVNCRMRPSVLNREYQRIENKVRSHPHYYATENYLNSSNAKEFDDETRDIRTTANSLLKKVHTRVQRSHSLSPMSYASKYENRYGPDAYISRVLAPIKGITEDSNAAPVRKYPGLSHLASVRIVGNKGYAKRKPAISYNKEDKVRNDVNLLSYYLKNRKAAAAYKVPAYVLESAET